MKLSHFIVGAFITFGMFFITASLVLNATRVYKKNIKLIHPYSNDQGPLSPPIYQLTALDNKVKFVSFRPFPKLLNTPLVTELVIDTNGSVVSIHVIRPSVPPSTLTEQLTIIKSWQFSVGTVHNKPVYYRIYWAG